MFEKVLIANRGTIACRIQRALRKLGVGSVAIYSPADRDSLHVREADEAVALRGSLPAESYLDVEQVLAAAQQTGADAIHPGYGFLSENASFAEACEQAGVVFIGPTAEQLRTCGLKHLCREIARERDVPLLEGSAVLEDLESAKKAAEEAGYPVILKSSAGGGGIGMQVAESAEDLPALYEQVRRLSAANFGDDSLFLEKYIRRARHLEVQIFGDGEGTVVDLGERDCSTQRRNQKVIEESPAVGLSDEDREQLCAAAVRMTESVCYRSAGTVEFLWDDDREEFSFLEINARLQVEHGVTEECWGVDLVDWMVRQAAGDLPPLQELRKDRVSRGHAVQVRLYAEDPSRAFQPSSGLVTHFRVPDSVRAETWMDAGTSVSSFYDPLIGKLIAHGDTREGAVEQLEQALGELACYGIETNQAYLGEILKGDVFREGKMTTRYLDSFA
ncbi:MAG: biotin carboxylase N-terminal domain-containing protein, partial [Verrucomicrobiota bacterium]